LTTRAACSESRQPAKTTKSYETPAVMTKIPTAPFKRTQPNQASKWPTRQNNKPVAELPVNQPCAQPTELANSGRKQESLTPDQAPNKLTRQAHRFQQSSKHTNPHRTHSTSQLTKQWTWHLPTKHQPAEPAKQATSTPPRFALPTNQRSYRSTKSTVPSHQQESARISQHPISELFCHTNVQMPRTNSNLLRMMTGKQAGSLGATPDTTRLPAAYIHTHTQT